MGCCKETQGSGPGAVPAGAQLRVPQGPVDHESWQDLVLHMANKVAPEPALQVRGQPGLDLCDVHRVHVQKVELDKHCNEEALCGGDPDHVAVHSNATPELLLLKDEMLLYPRLVWGVDVVEKHPSPRLALFACQTCSDDDRFSGACNVRAEARVRNQGPRIDCGVSLWWPRRLRGIHWNRNDDRDLLCLDRWLSCECRAGEDVFGGCATLHLHGACARARV